MTFKRILTDKEMDYLKQPNGFHTTLPIIYAIVGSREYPKLYLVESYIKSLPKDTKIISGGAPGVDTAAIEAAKKHGYEWEEFHAKWQDLTVPNARVLHGRYGFYNANAGFDRNTILVLKADFVVAFSNGSGGTEDTIRKAIKKRKLKHVFNAKGEDILIKED